MAALTVERSGTLPRAATVRVSERQLMDALIEAARWRGWLVYHTHDSRHSTAGFPDLVMLRGDRCVVVECKAAHGKLSKAQQAWHLAFLAAGIPAYVIHPSDQDWFMAEVLV